jgi:hypothetical protein
MYKAPPSLRNSTGPSVMSSGRPTAVPDYWQFVLFAGHHGAFALAMGADRERANRAAAKTRRVFFTVKSPKLKWGLHRDNVTAEGCPRRNRSGFALPENVTEMTLKSALDDLSRTTLEAVAGCLRKLEYLAGLRHRAGDYAHWGMGKVYGRTTANKALGTAHREVVSVVLSTPLGTLLEDVENSSAQAGVDTERYLGNLAGRPEELLPNDPGAGSARHLRSVLRALVGLERTRQRNATRRAS